VKINTLKNKINEVKTRSNLIYDLKRKEVQVLSKEISEDEEILYIISFLTGLRRQHYIVLTSSTLYWLKKNKIVEKLKLDDIEISHIEIEEDVVGKIIIKTDKKVLEFNIYNLDIKKLVDQIKLKNKELVFNKQFIEKEQEIPSSKSKIVLSLIIVGVIFLSVVLLVLYLMIKLNLL
jgi:hypothetical protein